MFATLTGPLPDRPDLLELQVEAGIGLLADGTTLDPAADPGGAWRRSAARVPGHPLKACLDGPGPDPSPGLVGALAQAIRELADAGCPVVELREAAIPEDPATVRRLLDAHGRLADALGPDELAALPALALGPGAERLGDELLRTPYRSFTFDLIAGPDDWRLAVRVPPDRGLVCGVIGAASSGAGDLETATWAARYAAASRGRGPDRVGLTNAGGLTDLAPDRFAVKVRLLGEAARLGTAPRAELERILNPRALGPR